MPEKSKHSNLSKYKNTLFTLDVIKKIVTMHNKLRAKVANGEGKAIDGMLPSASDMYQIYWDEQIARNAQKWANNCKYKESPDEYRKKGDMVLGENVFRTLTTDTVVNLDLMDWDAATNDWYSQIGKYPKILVDKINFDGPPISSFSQLIWSKSYLIGCGYCGYVADGQLTKIYVCQYGPKGNNTGEPNYKSGIPATKCENNTFNSKGFPGLCCRKDFCDTDSLSLEKLNASTNANLKALTNKVEFSPSTTIKKGENRKKSDAQKEIGGKPIHESINTSKDDYDKDKKNRRLFYCSFN